jgi:hypothetical protein
MLWVHPLKPDTLSDNGIVLIVYSKILFYLSFLVEYDFQKSPVKLKSCGSFPEFEPGKCTSRLLPPADIS